MYVQALRQSPAVPVPAQDTNMHVTMYTWYGVRSTYVHQYAVSELGNLWGQVERDGTS
jgi:hypothetical protein